MEQSEARSDATQAAIDDRSAAHEEAVDRAYDARQENIAEANQPDENASEKLNDVSKERTVYQSEAQTRLDKLGVRLDEAAQKLNVLGARAPTALKTELKTATTEYRLLKQDVSKLDQTPTTAWESTTEKIDSRMAALDSRVEDLTESIEGV